MASTLRGIASYYENRKDYTTFFYEGTFYTTALDTPTLRNILTTAFVLLNYMIVLFGAFFMKVRTIHRLRTRRKPVPINHLTSWTSLTGTLTYAWDTFQLPGGFCGLLMLLTGAFGLVHQYFVNSFILPEFVQTRCNFESGIVMKYVTRLPVPMSTWSAASTVYNAQYQAYVNDGIFGIYDKVNDNSFNFSPTTQDVLGSWNCTQQSNINMARKDWQTQNSVDSFLQNQNFLFTEAHAPAYQFNADDHSVNGFLVWTADQPDDSTKQWKFRASVANNLNGSAAPADSTAPVTSLECQLHLAKAGWTPPVMPSYDSLMEWAPKTYGFLMNDQPEHYGSDIEWMLNAMVMVGGSGNRDQWGPSTLPVGASTTYGCTVKGSKIMPEIWAILGLMLLIFVPLVLADIFLTLCQHFQHKYIAKADQTEAAPSSVQKWQLFSLREARNDHTIKATQMRNYS